MSNTSPLTFCISCFNNLNYLKLAVESVRKNSYYKDAPFVVYAENCNDGTDEWLVENRDRYNLTPIIEKNQTPKGIGGGMNVCAANVKTEYILFLHADFYVGKNWDKACYDTAKGRNKIWVNPYRVEPNLYNQESRPGSIMVDVNEFGSYHHDFDGEYFDRWSEEFSTTNDFQINKAEGVSGLIKTQEYIEMGGNDPRFAPAYWEDADLFIRMKNEGFIFVITTKGVIYHFGSRASRYPTDDLKSRPKHLSEIEQKSLLEFVKKYGKLPNNDSVGCYVPMQPIDGSPNKIEFTY